MKYIWIIIFGLLLFAGFKSLKLLISRISSEKNYFRNLWITVSIAEFISWTGYIFMSVHSLFQNKSYYNYLLLGSILIFIVLLTYYFLNDLFAGAIFKIQHHPQKGKTYDFKKLSGKVKKVGSTSLIIESSEGQEIDVPYSQLKGPVYENKELKAQSDLKIRLSVEKKLSKEELVQRINEIVLTSAYSSFKKDPVVKIISEDDSHIQFEIIISTLSSKHVAMLERKLVESFS